MSKQKIPPEVLQLLEIAGNEQCVECDSRDVEWASMNLGVFLCEKCSGRHRALGTHVSQVRSLWLDSKAWTPDVIQAMSKKGNVLAKQYYEAKVPSFLVKPPEDQGPRVMEAWLILKYQQKLFVDPTSNHIYNTKSDDTNNTDEKTPAVFSPTNKIWIVTMPHTPYGKALRWINPANKTYTAKEQYIVVHGRWISRYSNSKNSTCEQRLDLSKVPIWIDESELNKPIVVAIGPNNTDGMRLEFDTFEEAKQWTEKLRQSGQYYRSLDANSSPEAPYPLIDRDLELEAHHFDKAKHLGWANKRKARLMVGWDRRYFIVHNNILYYLTKEPHKLITAPKSKTKCTASGGYRMSEVDVCVDVAGNRSGQEHCLLLYHFDRTIFIRFDERWPLLECYKVFHREMKHVDFSTPMPSFTAKQEVQNIDMLLAQEQQAKQSSHTRHSERRAQSLAARTTLGGPNDKPKMSDDHEKKTLGGDDDDASLKMSVGSVRGSDPNPKEFRVSAHERMPESKEMPKERTPEPEDSFQMGIDTQEHPPVTPFAINDHHEDANNSQPKTQKKNTLSDETNGAEDAIVPSTPNKIDDKVDPKNVNRSPSLSNDQDQILTTSKNPAQQQSTPNGRSTNGHEFDDIRFDIDLDIPMEESQKQNQNSNQKKKKNKKMDISLGSEEILPNDEDSEKFVMFTSDTKDTDAITRNDSLVKRYESNNEVYNREVRAISHVLETAVDKYGSLSDVDILNEPPEEQSEKKHKKTKSLKRSLRSGTISEDENESDSEDNMLYEQRQTIVHNWLKAKSTQSADSEPNNETSSMTPSPSPSPLPSTEIRSPPPKRALPGLPQPPKRNKPQAQLPKSKQFTLEEEQQKILANPDVLKILVTELGRYASFFVQQNTLMVHLHDEPTNTVWDQIREILIKHTGPLVSND